VHRLNAIRWEHWSEGGEVDVNEQSYDMDEREKLFDRYFSSTILLLLGSSGTGFLGVVAFLRL
jgi:hypothetical protein